MSYTEKYAIAFLKEMLLKIDGILKEAQDISVALERLYKEYVQFIEENQDISHLEAFKNLEKDLRNLYQTCKFIPNDCMDVKHSIAECSVELN